MKENFHRLEHPKDVQTQQETQQERKKQINKILFWKNLSEQPERVMLEK